MEPLEHNPVVFLVNGVTEVVQGSSLVCKLLLKLFSLYCSQESISGSIVLLVK